jgi:hypothetical protein
MDWIKNGLLFGKGFMDELCECIHFFFVDRKLIIDFTFPSKKILTRIFKDGISTNLMAIKFAKLFKNYLETK